jgi:hypothetical protein
MKQSPFCHILKNENSAVCGLFAEPMARVEHERGAGGIHETMGCGDVGIRGIRRFQPTPSSTASRSPLKLHEAKIHVGGSEERKNFVKRKCLTTYSHRYVPWDGYARPTGGRIEVWYSEKDFSIFPKNDEMEEIVTNFHRHALLGDIAVFTEYPTFTTRPWREGLFVVIPSLIPENFRDGIEDLIHARDVRSAARAAA